MMKKITFLSVLLLLAACTTGTTGELQQFIGGTEGVTATFEPNTPPAEAFDGGYAPFDVVVRLENKGEETVKTGDTTIRITGILEPEFNLKSGDLTKKVNEELTAVRKDATGKVSSGNPVFVEFKNFNHVSTITGNALDFPLRADVCYKYATHASTLLCSRSNILNPEANGICEVSGDKPVANSGAPVQAANVKQTGRSANSITLSFDLTHAGTGRVYQEDTACDKSERKYEDSIFVEVETKISGLSCSRLDAAGEGKAAGIIKMFGPTTTVTCTQTFARASDAVAPISITLGYDYEERVQTTVTIKHAGE